MKNKNEETKKLNKLTPQAVERLLIGERTLKDLKIKNEVSLETIKELDGLIAELLILRSSFVDNVINWTKQGFLVEYPHPRRPLPRKVPSLSQNHR